MKLVSKWLPMRGLPSGDGGCSPRYVRIFRVATTVFLTVLLVLSLLRQGLMFMLVGALGLAVLLPVFIYDLLAELRKGNFEVGASVVIITVFFATWALYRLMPPAPFLVTRSLIQQSAICLPSGRFF